MHSSLLVRPGIAHARRAAALAAPSPARCAAPHVLARRAAPRSARQPRLLVAYATGNQGDNKSWGEIASEAADVAKSVFEKVKTGASAALEAITKPKQPPAPLDRRPREPPAPPLFGGGLAGRVLGGLVGAAVKNLGEQMEQQARAARGVYEDAAAAIRASPEVSARMGGAVTVGPAMSQSSSSSSVNGRVTKQVALILPVTGPGGRMAQAQVISTEASGAVASTDIVVIMPNGEQIRVTRGRGGGGGAGGRYEQTGEVIDADYTDIRS